MTIQRLNIPDKWKHYFSEYPNGYTLLEAIIEWTNKVNIMIDDLNLTNEALEKFWLETLPENLEIILNQWYEDGTLADLINLQLLEKKADKEMVEGVIADLDEALLDILQVKNEISDLAVNIKTFGAIGNGLTDDTQAFLDMAAFCNSRSFTKIYIPNGTYKINQQITINKNVNISGESDISTILDFSTATGEFINNVGILITGNDPVKLPPPTTELKKNDTTITFSNSHGLQVGDILTILDAELFSYSGYREGYRKSEMVKVINVNSLIVTLDRPIYDSYLINANLNIHKLNTINANVSNIGFNLKLTETVGGAGVMVRYGKDCKLSDLRGKGSNWTQVVIENCYNTVVTRLNIDYNSTPIGYNYGFLISNCQKVLITDSYLKTSRHGLAIGGQNFLTSIINRELDIVNCTISSYTTSGADMHGNVEFVRYKNCNIENGVTISGDYTEVSNCMITTDPQGIAIILAEVKGMDHTIKNNEIKCGIYTQLNSSGYGVFRGITSTNLKEGGTLIVKDNNFSAAPDAALLSFYNLSLIEYNVFIENNKLTRDVANLRQGAGVGFRGNYKTLRINGNYLNNCDISFNKLNADYVEIKNNNIINSSAMGITLAYEATSTKDPIIKIENNHILKAGYGSLQLLGINNLVGYVSVINNMMLDANEFGPTSAAITDSSAYINKFKTAEFKNNIIGDRRQVMKQRVQYYINDITNLIEQNNINVGGVLSKTINNITNNINALLFNQDNKNRRVGYGTTPPISGDWEVGSIFYNTAPTSGGFIGWVCIAVGTWKGFGMIDI